MPFPAALDALVAAFRPRCLLQVLDNCEHLLAGCAPMVETLLASNPDLTVLATSREARGDWRYVPTASYPDEDADLHLGLSCQNPAQECRVLLIRPVAAPCFTLCLRRVKPLLHDR